MSMRNIPPEAFTHRELAEAMNWRETQPEYVKTMTNTPEALVSFYKKAQRTQTTGGSQNLSTTKMSESFRSDLKNLAEGLKTFEAPAGGAAGPAGGGSNPTLNQSHYFAEETPRYQPAPQPKMHAPAASVINYLDEQSLSMIHEVKRHFNLGNEVEAVRLLLKLGYDQAKRIFPPSHGL